MSDIFKAISDPTRRAILLKVAEEATSINMISENFKMSRPAVSKHIKILQENKLIEIRSDQADGRQRNCYAQLEALREVQEYLQELYVFWDMKLDKLGQFLDNNKIEEK